jgi:uncharacterized membrane protein
MKPVYLAAVALLLPATAAAVHLIVRALLPHPVSPSVREPVNAISMHVVIFVIALQILIIADLAGVGWARALGPRAVVVLLAALLVSAGNLLPRLRPNPAIGIRTARTIDDPRLWARLHRCAGYTAVIAGCALGVAGVFLSGPAIGTVVTICAIGAIASLTIARWGFSHD